VVTASVCRRVQLNQIFLSLFPACTVARWWGVKPEWSRSSGFIRAVWRWGMPRKLGCVLLTTVLAGRCAGGDQAESQASLALRQVAAPTRSAIPVLMPLWVEPPDPALMAVSSYNVQNLRGQSLLFRCIETGFITTAPALTRYQQGRGIDPSRRELVGDRPAQWCRSSPVTICEHCGLAIKGNQWTLRQHQQSKRCRKSRSPLPL